MGGLACIVRATPCPTGTQTQVVGSGESQGRTWRRMFVTSTRSASVSPTMKAQCGETLLKVTLKTDHRSFWRRMAEHYEYPCAKHNRSTSTSCSQTCR